MFEAGERKNFGGMGTQGNDTLVPDPCGLSVLHVLPIPAPDVEREGTLVLAKKEAYASGFRCGHHLMKAQSFEGSFDSQRDDLLRAVTSFTA